MNSFLLLSALLLSSTSLLLTANAFDVVCNSGYYPYVSTGGDPVAIDLSPLTKAATSKHPNFYANGTVGEVYFNIGNVVAAEPAVGLETDCYPRTKLSLAQHTSACLAVHNSTGQCTNSTLCWYPLGTCQANNEQIALLSSPLGARLTYFIQNGTQELEFMDIYITCDMKADVIPAYPLSLGMKNGYYSVMNFSSPYGCPCSMRNEDPDANLHCPNIETLCGAWEQDCQAVNGYYVKSSLALNYYVHPGLTDPDQFVGDFVWDSQVYIDKDCVIPMMTMSRSGNWQDKGQSQRNKGGRFIELLGAAVIITPQTEDAAQQLNQTCNCNLNWNTSRVTTVAYCDSCTVPVLGLVNPGSPLYGVAVAQDNALKVTQFTGDAITGFNQYIYDNSTALKRVSSCASTLTQPSVCGRYENNCHYSLDSVAVLDDVIEFNENEGTFLKSEKLYNISDSYCNFEAEMEFSLEGKFKIQDPAINFKGARNIEIRVSSATFTPLTAFYVEALEKNCPCGKFSLNSTTTITSCPAGVACNLEPITSGFLNLEIGDNKTNYGNVARFGKSIMMTSFSTDQQTGYAMLPDPQLFPWAQTDASNVYCPAGTPASSKGHHLSTGSAILIAFFVILAVYVIGGVVLNKQRGYTGSEVFPNSEFWADIWTSVKEGVAFSMNGCGLCAGDRGYSSLN